MERFGPVGNFASTEQCRSIFPWLVPPVSDRSDWHNGKHPKNPVALPYLQHFGWLLIVQHNVSYLPSFGPGQ